MNKPIISQSGTFLLAGEQPIYRLGFGAMRLTGPSIWGKHNNPKECQAILHRTIELGVNFFDTADSYGPEVSENIIAETLYPYPKGLIIATKGGLTRPSPSQWNRNGHPDYLMQCVDKSLQRLRLDCIDLYQLHAVDPAVPLEDSLGALKSMQQQGKIRHIGLSNVSVAEIERARKIIPVVSVQNQYNLSYRQSEDVLNYCEKNSIGFIPWFPIGSGELAQPRGPLEYLAKHKKATPVQMALAWLLKRSKVMLPIPGTASLSHLEENCAAAAITLTDQEFSDLDDY